MDSITTSSSETGSSLEIADSLERPSLETWSFLERLLGVNYVAGTKRWTE